jgi:hypothetical protein
MKELEVILKILYDTAVEFVVIGGAAMHLQGSAYVTKDVDFCYSRTQKNVERLASALRPYRPRLRGVPGDLPFSFDARTVTHGLNFTLTTELGDLDFLGEVTGLGSYEDVKAAADTRIIDGIPIAVLSRRRRPAGRGIYTSCLN